MKLLFTGSGKSGSWSIRGDQIGRAIGATVAPNASMELIESADVTVVVKRVSDEMLGLLRGRRWVWDIVDAWPQPKGNEWQRERAIAWLRGELSRLKPYAVVFPTQRMALDSGWGGRQLTLPHHAWPKYVDAVTVVRESVSVVGYEGGDYLGRWLPVIERECSSRGWRLMINGDMRDADIGIALRDASGYPAKAWKSNCKLANIQALGIPAVLSVEAGYSETRNGTEIWVDRFDEIGAAFDKLSEFSVRKEIAEKQRSSAPQLKDIAVRYFKWLSQLSS